jgi:hypothetical protein
MHAIVQLTWLQAHNVVCICRDCGTRTNWSVGCSQELHSVSFIDVEHRHAAWKSAISLPVPQSHNCLDCGATNNDTLRKTSESLRLKVRMLQHEQMCNKAVSKQRASSGAARLNPRVQLSIRLLLKRCLRTETHLRLTTLAILERPAESWIDTVGIRALRTFEATLEAWSARLAPTDRACANVGQWWWLLLRQQQVCTFNQASAITDPAESKIAKGQIDLALTEAAFTHSENRATARAIRAHLEE